MRYEENEIQEMGNEAEHILICLSPSPSNAKVIKTAGKMAEAFRCSLTALYVERSDEAQIDNEQLKENMKLAENVGAKIAIMYGNDIEVQIAEYARVGGFSKIVIGRTNDKRGLFYKRKNMADKLLALMPDMDFYVIPDKQPRYARKIKWSFQEKIDFRQTVLNFIRMLSILILSTGIGFVFFLNGLGEDNIIMVYILAVLIVSIWTSRRVIGGITSLLSVLMFNFLFTEPRFTFRVNDAKYPITFLIMLVASFITSSLAMRLLEQAKMSAREAYKTSILLETNQKLQRGEDSNSILQIAGKQLEKLLGRTVVIYPYIEEAELGTPQIYNQSVGKSDYEETQKDYIAAKWTGQNGKLSGNGTKTFPEVQCLYMAVRGERRVYAVAGIYIEEKKLEEFEKNLLANVLDGAALVLDKAELQKEKQQVELKVEQESLRANLLRSISHDLRTPLTSISGNAGILMEGAERLEPERKKKIYSDIYEDANWLTQLVENLLSVTRIENGTMGIKLETELLEEVFDEAMSHLDRKSKDHVIKMEMKEDLLLAVMDARLIIQVLINILNNAIKYTQTGSEIILSAEKSADKKELLIKISDNGPGIPEEAKENIFDMFYTLGKGKGDGRRGLGLGLALCKSIIASHGGRIWVEDNKPSGAVFCFTLQLAEVEMYE